MSLRKLLLIAAVVALVVAFFTFDLDRHFGSRFDQGATG